MMKTFSVMTLAAVAAVGAAAPAYADFNRLATISVSPAREETRIHSSFGGPVEALQLTAERSDISCRSVRVTFANGRVRNVFSGRLEEGDAETIDLPGYQRNVRRIDFRCRALDRRSARLEVAVDVGQYRETWRRNPNFMRLWSRVFNWDDNDRYAGRDRDDRDRGDRDRDNRRDEWVRLGSERFEGRERAATFTGFRGRQLEALGLQPVDDDARCSMLRVHFANGQSRDIRIGERLNKDRIYRVDLPGDERNVRELELVCRPAGDDDVTVNIYGIT